MRRSIIVRITLAWVLIGGALALIRSAAAGPPLICHEIRVPEGQSLPWGKDGFSKARGYSTSGVVRDTLELLSPRMPVLVRMETLRRATLYIDDNQSQADELLGELMARALDAEAAGAPDALAWFDAGYLAQCYRQSGTKASFGPAASKAAGSGAIAGYSWVVKALDIAGSNPQMEIAAALMTADHRVPQHEAHLKRALAADATELAPQAEDVLRWIAEINGSTIEALRAKYGLTDARSSGR